MTAPVAIPGRVPAHPVALDLRAVTFNAAVGSREPATPMATPPSRPRSLPRVQLHVGTVRVLPTVQEHVIEHDSQVRRATADAALRRALGRAVAR